MKGTKIGCSDSGFANNVAIADSLGSTIIKAAFTKLLSRMTGGYQ